MGSILKSTYNTRFISKTNSRSQIIRSDKLDLCGEEDILFLKNAGVRHVIDLRNLKDKEPNSLLHAHGIGLLNCTMPPKMASGHQGSEGRTFLPYYVSLLGQYETLKGFFRIVLNSEGGILVNCSLGRDRTGVISFLIELIAGFSMNEIVEDMAVSDSNLENGGNELDIRTNLNYLEAKGVAAKLHACFYSSFRNVEEYLGIVGLSEREIFLLVRKIQSMTK